MIPSSLISDATWSYSDISFSCSSSPSAPFVGFVSTKTQHVGLLVAPAFARSWNQYFVQFLAYWKTYKILAIIIHHCICIWILHTCRNTSQFRLETVIHLKLHITITQDQGGNTSKHCQEVQQTTRESKVLGRKGKCIYIHIQISS